MDGFSYGFADELTKVAIFKFLGKAKKVRIPTSVEATNAATEKVRKATERLDKAMTQAGVPSGGPSTPEIEKALAKLKQAASGV